MIGLAANTAFAEDYTTKCMALYNTDCQKNMKMEPDLVHQCIIRGWDAPITCRNNRGVSAGVDVAGAKGFSYNTISSPQDSAGRVGAPPTVDTDTIRRTVPGIGCVLPGGFNICQFDINLKKTPVYPPNPSTSTGDMCPVKHDTSGAYGVKTPLELTAPASINLACGGAIPLSTYTMTLNKNANAIASTEYGAFYVWLYKQAGAGGAFNASGTAMKLPTVLCKPRVDNLNQPMFYPDGTPQLVKSIDLTAPVAQMIMYNQSNMTNLVLRLKSRETLDPTTIPTPIPQYDPDLPEKYLVFPMVGGVPQIPSDPTNLSSLGAMTADMVANTPLNGCALESTYLKTLQNSNMSADLTIDSATVGPCEGSAEQCGTSSTAPTTDQSCDVVNLTPTGATCSSKTQYVVLDRPNLVLPSGTATNVTPINGRSAVLVSTVDNSRVYMQTSTVLRVGKGAGPVLFNEGGSIDFSDGTKLNLFAPATVNANTGQITLSGGGQHLSAGGNLLQSYSASSTPSNFTTTDKVITVSANRSITLPAGYLIPSMATIPASGTVAQQKPYVQIPAGP